MTREEALDILYKERQLWICYDVDDTDFGKALKMAIEALEHQERPRDPFDNTPDDLL